MKNKTHILKLTEAFLLILIALVLAGTGVYAWQILSVKPEVSGIQTTIGSSTIKVAPDAVDENGNHTPGTFADTMDLGREETYQWLSELRGLTPVSTTDGEHWYTATYDDLADGGEIKDVSEFVKEESPFAWANQKKTDEAQAGSYVYLDFWVMAPDGDYTLRVATGTSEQDQGGSFVMAKPAVVADEEGNYQLTTEHSQAEACIRMGFQVTDELGNKTFSIYEPNCDLHPQDTVAQGKYQLTYPLEEMENGTITEADPAFLTSLALQKAGSWVLAENGTDTKISQSLQAAVLQAQANNIKLSDADKVGTYFLGNYLQNQLGEYVATGSFVKLTSSVIIQKEEGKERPDEVSMEDVETAGAATDAVITQLKKDIPQRIRMFIWLEGQDADCTNEAMLNQLLINIELAGESGKAS